MSTDWTQLWQKRFDSVRASGADALKQAQAAGLFPVLTATPTSEGELSDLLRCASSEGRKVLVVGRGTKLCWGGLPGPCHVLIDTSRLQGLTDYDPADLTASCRSGTTYRELQGQLNFHKQWLSLDSPWDSEASVGGILATSASGPRRFGYGDVRDLVLGVRAVLPDGSTVRFGGKTVKNVAGYDVSKLFVGSFGTLGVITEVTFRLRPQPAEEASLLCGFAGWSAAEAAVCGLLRSPDPLVSIELLGEGAWRRLARAEGDGGPVLALRLEGSKAVVEAACARTERTVLGAGVQWLARLGGQESSSFWAAYESALYVGWAASNLVVRLTGPVCEAVNVVRDFEREGRVAAWSHAGTGVGYALYPASEPSFSAANLVNGLRHVFHSRGVRVDCLAAPLAAKKVLQENEIDFWDAKDSLLARARSIKNVFDPLGIMVSGRFVGGI